MLSAILTFALKFVSSGILESVIGRLNDKDANQTERMQIAAGIAIEQIQAERARRNAQRDLALAGMNHPIWWVAWALFVLPVGLYHAAIFITSTLGFADLVLRVPPVQEEWGWQMIQSIFLAQVTTGVVGAAAHVLKSIFARK